MTAVVLEPVKKPPFLGRPGQGRTRGPGLPKGRHTAQTCSRQRGRVSPGRLCRILPESGDGNRERAENKQRTSSEHFSLHRSLVENLFTATFSAPAALPCVFLRVVARQAGQPGGGVKKNAAFWIFVNLYFSKTCAKHSGRNRRVLAALALPPFRAPHARRQTPALCCLSHRFWGTAPCN